MNTSAPPRAPERHPAVRAPGRRSADLLWRWGPAGAAIAAVAILAVRTPAIVSWANIQAALTQAAPIAVVAVGLAVVVVAGGDDIIEGGIDLSLPAIATLATAIVTMRLAQGTPFGWALAAGIGVAVAFGALNAALVAAVGLTPILATLATSVLVSGVIRVVTTNRRTTTDHPIIVTVRDGDILGIPVAALIALAIAAAAWCAVHRTAFGLRAWAVGGNRDAARVSGLAPARYIAASFLVAALIAGADAVLLAARGSGFSPGMEERLLVDMVLAGYLSPVFSRRAVVGVAGAAASALLVALLSNALILSRLDNSWVYGFKGALILAVVVFGTQRARRAAS